MSIPLSEVEALPPSNSGEPLTLVLRALLPQLRPAERRVATYVIDHPDQARHLAITALALVTGVSVASVTRLTKAVGCTEFRRRRSPSPGRHRRRLIPPKLPGAPALP